MRKWPSGMASASQAEDRGFESRLSLHAKYVPYARIFLLSLIRSKEPIHSSTLNAVYAVYAHYIVIHKTHT